MLAVTATFSLLFTMGVAVARVSAQPHERTATEPEDTRVLPVPATPSGSVTVGQFHHHSAAYWNWRYRTMRHLAYIRHKRIRQLTRVLLARPSVAEAINLAATVYGNGATLWRRARCESRLDPNARNGSEASGLLQFLPSTWATTPFSRFSVFSPYANALAAGWMIGPAGRGSEWSCR